ncbi:MAG: hypothetical protein Q8P20_08015 [bacterium]|nr:hypothetical protein [bacterium]MDZ4227886.1 hypothetical protein [Candidatus Levybacteria bacterium]
MNKSLIFTQAETEAYNRRLKGDRKDPTGIFSGRVKPKILELLDWFRRKNEMKKILKTIRETKK